MSAIRAALDETERLARRASRPEWRFDGTSSSGPRVIVGDGDDDVWEREVNPSVWTCDDELDGCPDEARGWVAEGQHIAANDPAAVLRWVAALREIVDAYEAERARGPARPMGHVAESEARHGGILDAYQHVLRQLAHGLIDLPADELRP